MNVSGAPASSLTSGLWRVVLGVLGAGALVACQDRATLAGAGAMAPNPPRGACSAVALAQPVAADLDVKKLGAVGDGRADDWGALQAAVDTAGAQGGGVVYLPPGVYRISRAVTVRRSNVQILGSGRTSRLLSSSPTAAAIHIGHESDMDSCAHTLVKGLLITREPDPEADYDRAPSYGIRVERARDTTIDDVSISRSAYGIAVGVKGTTAGLSGSVASLGTVISNTLMVGATLLDAGVIFYSSADARLINAQIEPRHRGIVMSNDSNGITVSNAIVVNGGAYDYGIVSEGSGFGRYITGSIIENARHQQIYIGGTSSGVVVADSWMGAGDASAEALNRAGVLIEPGASNVLIANNRIGDQRSAAIISSGREVEITGNRLEWNVNASSRMDSIMILGGRHVTISENRVQSATDRCSISIGPRVEMYIVTGNDLSEESGSRVGVCDAGPGPGVIGGNLE